MGNWDMQLAYMEQVYKKLDKLGENQNKETWLVKNNMDKRLYIWKEIEIEMTDIYQKLRVVPGKNLASVLDVVRIGDKAVIIEEYISGSTLQELIQFKRIGEGMAVNIICQLLEALSEIHGQNIIHRDINPQNVLLSTDGVVKLLDFGIAREPKAGQGKDTTILGTAGYAAPEQFGFQQTDERSDIYSLGGLFHVMLTGRLPEGNICCKPEYRNFIQKCISLEPRQRYQSALEAYKDLENSRKTGKAAVSADMTRGRKENQDIENPVYSQKETAAVAERQKVNPYIPVGFRSKGIWKKLVAGSFYVMVGIYIPTTAVECAATPISFFLELTALMLYLVLSFVCLTNYGNWVHRIWPFSKLNEKWEMLIRFAFFLVAFNYGYDLEQYVKITMLGFKE